MASERVFLTQSPPSGLWDSVSTPKLQAFLRTVCFLFFNFPCLRQGVDYVDLGGLELTSAGIASESLDQAQRACSVNPCYVFFLGGGGEEKKGSYDLTPSPSPP